jgi:hypothetical protein
MTANIAFALSAAVLSLAIVVGAGIKGNWTVVVVYAMLLAGFLARASYGRRAHREERQRRQQLEPGGADDGPPAAPPGPEHAPERELRRAGFKRR